MSLSSLISYLFPQSQRSHPSFWYPILRIWFWYVILTWGIVIAIWSVYLPYRDQIVRITQTQHDLLYDVWPRDHEIRIVDHLLAADTGVWTYTPSLLSRSSLTSLAGKPIHDFLRVDASAEASLYRSYDAYIVLNRTGLIIQNHDLAGLQEINYTQLSPEANFTLNTSSFQQFLSSWQPFMTDRATQTSILFILSLIFIIVNPTFVVTMYLIRLIIYVIYTYLLGRLMGERYTFGYLYRFGLWLLPFVIIVHEVLWWMLRVTLPSLSYIGLMMIFYLIFLPRKTT